MKQFFQKWLTLFIYSQSSNKKQLDRYINRIRNLQPLSAEEWKDLEQLAQHEASVLHPVRAGKMRIVHKEIELSTNSFEKAKTKTKESFFMPDTLK